MAALLLEKVTKSFGSAAVISPLSLEVKDGEFCVLVGPSGCGKSTLLRLIAGLEPVSSGRILIDGVDVSRAEPVERGVAMVFQSYALYPHMNVERNIGFGLEIARRPRKQILERVAEAAAKLHMSEYLLRRPSALSGGQRQRVAIGRAITRDPKLFLLDEPLSNLDAALRAGMRIEIARLKADLTSTIVYVTHDQVEAMTLADRIVVMRAGKIEQIGGPLELYERPDNMFVASFIGSPAINLLQARLETVEGAVARVRLRLGPVIEIPLGLPAEAGTEAIVGIRPERVRVGGPDAVDLVQGDATMLEMLGSDTFVHWRSGDEKLVIREDGRCRLRKGDRIPIRIDAGSCHLFAPSGRRISAAREPIAGGA
jgi:multiple sugar transport system ATP-binding protein